MVLDHVGIAVADLEEGLLRWQRLGYVLEARGDVASQGVAVAMLKAPPGTQGSARLELLAPLAPDTPVGRFLQKRGEGLHHLAFRVKDIEAELKRLEAEGASLIDPRPRPGFGGHLVAFVHPKSFGGVLVELVAEHI